MKLSTSVLSLVLVVTIFPGTAFAGKCINVETSKPVRVSLSCGFGLIGDLFNKGDWYKKGDRVCKNNKLGILPMPCSFEVYNGQRSCWSGVRYGGNVTIKDDVMPDFRPPGASFSPHEKPGKSCNWS